MTDTDPKTEEFYRQLLMAKSPQERFKMGLSMCETARAMVLATLPPNLTPAERRVAIFRRYYQTDFTPEEMIRIEQALRESTRTYD